MHLQGLTRAGSHELYAAGLHLCNDPCHDYHCRDHQVTPPNPGDIISWCHSQQTDKNENVKCPVNHKPDKTSIHGPGGVVDRDCSKNQTMKIVLCTKNLWFSAYS
jgi:hypothetical protein